MFRALLPFLQCAICSYAPLLLVVSDEDDDEVLEGGVVCGQCSHVSPVEDGILDVLGAAPVPWTPAQLTNFAPPGAWGYERLWRWRALSLMSGRPFPLREELRMVRALVGPQQGGLIVDIACSTGLYARSLATSENLPVVAAVDHSDAMLREAQRRARREGRRVSFVRAAAQWLPFRTASASACVIGGSLNEIGDRVSALRETRRLLRRDGRFVSMHLLRARSVEGRALQRLIGWGGIDFPAEETLGRDFAEAGFRMVSHWRWRVAAIALLLPRDVRR